jgi:hypothetical protein
MEAVQTLENLEPADIIFSDSAAKKVSDLIQEEKNDNLKLRLIQSKHKIHILNGLTRSPFNQIVNH